MTLKINVWSKILWIIWIALVLPWVILAPYSAMAFDAGPSLKAYVFVWSILSYPVSVIFAAVFKQKMPLIVLLPSLNIAVAVVAGSIK